MQQDQYTTRDLQSLPQSWPLPRKQHAIDIIAAGGIVRDAHLPAYRKAGFPMAGIYDPDPEQAHARAREFGIPRVYESLEEAVSQENVIDLATPPEAHLEVQQKIPQGSTVLIQKPMGRDQEEARKIRELCREKQLKAAGNFQLRFSPMMLPIREALARGVFGELNEVEIRLACKTPWELWPFLEKLEDVEVLVHSIHYLDWIRSLLGEPSGAYCHAVPHPRFPNLKDARNSIILAYDRPMRCCLSLNHTYSHGPRHQQATIRIEGDRGAAQVSLGLLLNYPEGEPETLEIVSEGLDWTSIPLNGRWFPDAFIGVMSNLQRYADGDDETLITSVEDAFGTMALVDACIRSNRSGATPVEQNA